MKIQRITVLILALIAVAGCSKEKQPPAAESAPAQPQKQEVTPPQKESATINPAVTYAPKPMYPQAMFERCIEGEVQVRMRVNAEGLPENPEIVESTDKAFSDALMSVVPQWRFNPARKDGVAIARTVSISIPFLITERPIDLPHDISQGKPELLSAVRPEHPGKGSASAVVRFSLLSGTIVSNVNIVKTEGVINKDKLLETLSQWVFIPAEDASADENTSTVEAKVIFTNAGNVLIDYPYPTPGENNDTAQSN